MKIQLELSAQAIADLMVTVVEGNHMVRAWCNGIFINGSWGKRYEDPYDTADGKPLPTPWYSNPDIYEGAFIIYVEEILDESKRPEGDNIKTHKITDKDFAKAFALMAEKQPHTLANIIGENYDIVDADVFIQLAALGEVVYG